YKDHDVNLKSDILGYFVPNDKSLLNLENILDWLIKIDTNREQYFLNWLDLRKKISWETKMKEFLNFANEILVCEQ
ncbi:MAG: hypothetical protein ACKPKO_46655, partial [Candidatus Fonsibacter sp.]